MVAMLFSRLAMSPAAAGAMSFSCLAASAALTFSLSTVNWMAWAAGLAAGSTSP